MIRRKAYAKLDLAIHIDPKKKADGYFPVHYIDCQIDLCDRLGFENQANKIEVGCDDPSLPEGKDNFVNRAAQLVKKTIGRKSLGAKITLEKNIPIKAGFGGGSSDAAATILGLLNLWKVKLDESQKKRIARSLGKDFYYSLYGGLSEVIGDGKNYKVTVLSSRLPRLWLLIVVPSEQKPSTAWVYEHLKTKDIGHNFDKLEKLKTAILKSDKIGILKNLTNDFEDFMSFNFPIIGTIKTDLARVGAQATIMAGSGLSVVGFFDSLKNVQAAKNKLKNMQGLKKVLVTKIKN